VEIFPAIDLKDRHVVRLKQGDFDHVTVYDGQPAAVAGRFAGEGAKNLHIVDLDGAREGNLANIDKIRGIVNARLMFIQVGGGIRDEAAVDAYLNLGVNRIILGTIAVEDFEFLEQMLEKHGDKIAVSVDSREGKVAVRGWLEDSALDAVEFCEKLEKAGVKTIIFTDISRDGLLIGTNRDIYRTLKAKLSCNIIAAGGVSSLEDIRDLAEIGLHGAVVGKALYEGTLTLAEALEAAKC